MNTADSVRIKQLEEQVRQLQDENKKLRNEFDEYKLLHEPLITPTKKRKSPTEIDSDYAEDDDQVEKPTKKRKVATPKQSALDAATVSEEEIQRQISFVKRKIVSAFKAKLKVFNKNWGAEKSVSGEEVISQPAFLSMMKTCPSAKETGQTKAVLRYEVSDEDDWSDLMGSGATYHEFGTKNKVKFPVELTFSKNTSRVKVKATFVAQKN